MLDDLGEGYDAKVQQWHDNLKGFILSQLVSRIMSIMFCVYICIVCVRVEKHVLIHANMWDIPKIYCL